MKINKAELEAVAVKASQYPPEDIPEIAFAGRSNVGKSSLLNLITGRKALARVSGSPGKTRTINFYRCDDLFRIVDLPGYGFAKVSRSESEKWGAMIEGYLENRSNLRKVVQLVDIRHKPSAVATKADKVGNNQKAACIKTIRQTLGMSREDKVIPVSALKKTGDEELLEVITSLL